MHVSPAKAGRTNKQRNKQHQTRHETRVEVQVATMSMQLAIGNRFKYADLKSRWLKYDNESGYQVQVSQNVHKNKARYLSVCYTAPKTGWHKTNDGCRAHLKAIGDSHDCMTIESLDLTHTLAAERKLGGRETT